MWQCGEEYQIRSRVEAYSIGNLPLIMITIKKPKVISTNSTTFQICRKYRRWQQRRNVIYERLTRRWFAVVEGIEPKTDKTVNSHLGYQVCRNRGGNFHGLQSSSDPADGNLIGEDDTLGAVAVAVYDGPCFAGLARFCGRVCRVVIVVANSVGCRKSRGENPAAKMSVLMHALEVTLGWHLQITRSSVEIHHQRLRRRPNLHRTRIFLIIHIRIRRHRTRLNAPNSTRNIRSRDHNIVRDSLGVLEVCFHHLSSAILELGSTGDYTRD